MIQSDRYRRSYLMLRPLLLAGCVLSLTAPTLAQEVAQPLPNVAPLDPAAAARVAAQQQLTAALSQIARNGNDAMALTQAGRAALTLGDPRAALGFLARAEALAPRDPVIKAALGATMVQL
jgi:cytochrome c-type biogenesis protein CcmH/NrfG